MGKKKLHKGLKIALIVVISLVVLAVLTHLTINYLVPFISNMHNTSGAY